MKKIFVLLATLVLLTLTACMSEDTKAKLKQANTPPTKINIMFSSEKGKIAPFTYSDAYSGSIIKEIDDINFGKVCEVVSGNKWGENCAVIEFKGMGSDFLIYESITFKASLDSLTTKALDVRIGDNYLNGKTFNLSDTQNVKSLGNNWYEFKIKFSDFSDKYTNMAQDNIRILNTWKESGTFYITDVVLTKK